MLTGKIYWIADDFKFKGSRDYKKGETASAVTDIENIIVDDNMIEFTTSPFDLEGEQISYNVNLKPDDIGLGYSGNFYDKADRDWNGEMKCELFKDKDEKTFFLYGKWTEDDVIYTWWARIQK